VEKKYVEEVGSMNIMFKIDGKIYTAACTGTVLPGVTRRSCIELLRDWGYEVIEGKLAIADVMKAGHEGKLEEVFGTGTAAVVSPVKELDWKGDKVFISDGKIGEITQKLYDTMTGIQWGKLADTKGWIVPVCQG
jgi:branched-chain amino acid aminotransferase